MKRYTGERQILDLIDRYRFSKDGLLKEIEAMNDAIGEMAGTSEAYRIKTIKGRIIRKSKRVLWRDAQLEKLKQKLSELRTGEFVALRTDGSVSAK